MPTPDCNYTGLINTRSSRTHPSHHRPQQRGGSRRSDSGPLAGTPPRGLSTNRQRADAHVGSGRQTAELCIGATAAAGCRGSSCVGTDPGDVGTAAPAQEADPLPPEDHERRYEEHEADSVADQRQQDEAGRGERQAEQPQRSLPWRAGSCTERRWARSIQLPERSPDP